MIIPRLQAGLSKEGAREREILFAPLIAQNEDVFHRVCDKYWFINRCDRKDYIQEMKLRAWEKFNRWLRVRGNGIEFAQWLFMEARSAAFEYRCKQLHINRRNISLLYKDRVVLISDIDTMDRIDTDYDESQLQALDNAIADLKPTDRQVVQMYLSGEELEACSIAEGRNKSYYGGRMVIIRNRIRERRHLYFEDDIRVYNNSNPNKSRGLNQLNVTSKQVNQYSLTGDLIKCWPSTMEAERSGKFNAKNIQSVAKGVKRTHAGFVWLYVGDEPLLEQRIAAAVNKRGNESKPVLQKSLDGRLIRRWDTIRAATECGFCNIQRVCNGIQSTAGGFRWEWAND